MIYVKLVTWLINYSRIMDQHFSDIISNVLAEIILDILTRIE